MVGSTCGPVLLPGWPDQSGWAIKVVGRPPELLGETLVLGPSTLPSAWRPALCVVLRPRTKPTHIQAISSHHHHQPPIHMKKSTAHYRMSPWAWAWLVMMTGGADIIGVQGVGSNSKAGLEVALGRGQEKHWKFSNNFRHSANYSNFCHTGPNAEAYIAMPLVMASFQLFDNKSIKAISTGKLQITFQCSPSLI